MFLAHAYVDNRRLSHYQSHNQIDQNTREDEQRKSRMVPR
jgi:hypothetical protein